MMTKREQFYRYLGLPSFNPLELDIVKAEGVYLWDRDGKEYIDLVAGITVSNIGHRHPAVLDAIRKQLDQYLHLNVYGEFIQAPQVQLAVKLVSLLPSPLEAVYFVNSGSEAMEGALKLAKRFTGRTEIISFRNAYHGSTHGSLSITGHESLKNAFRPLLPDVAMATFNDRSDLEMISSRTACVVIEMVQAEAGIVRAEENYIRELKKICDREGVLIILDDVQMGMGRTGKLFSFEHYDFVPDILVLAKALGAGMPLGAFIASRNVMDTLASKPELGHITTFGGHPVSCAAAMAGLEVLTEGELIAEAEMKGRIFSEKLAGHPAVSAVRRVGLALGIDLSQVGKRNDFQQFSLEEGFVIDWYMFRPATFRLAPPLTITMEEIDKAINKVLAALDRLL